MKNITRKFWSPIEDGLLKEMYFKGSMNEMIEAFNRSWDAIKIHAAKLNLNRWNGFYRESDLSVLLNQSNETMYWLGFLLADGHVSNIRLSLKLAIKDEEHLNRFAKYINTTSNKGESTFVNGKRHKCISLSAQDIDIIPIFVQQYDISSNKTFNPPDISKYKLNKDQFISLFIGFIDGDGNIQKRVYSFFGRIKCHSSWLTNIQFIKNKFCEWLNSNTIQEPNINKQGHTEWCITAGMLRKIKKEAERLQLPILKRKWDIVN